MDSVTVALIVVAAGLLVVGGRGRSSTAPHSMTADRTTGIIPDEMPDGFPIPLPVR